MVPLACIRYIKLAAVSDPSVTTLELQALDSEDAAA